MKRCAVLLALLLFAVAAGCFRTMSHHTAEPTTSPTVENLRFTNLMEISFQLRTWYVGYPIPPTTLGPLAQDITNADLFVCPASGHSPGSLTNIEDWTDYIYFDLGDAYQAAPVGAPLLICPPENHHGQFANVIWFSGNREHISPEKCRALIKQPWCMVQNADAAQLEVDIARVRECHVRVPKRWAKAYPDAYAPDRANPSSAK